MVNEARKNWWRALRVTSQTLARIGARWVRHEWDSLQGHRRALLERASVAREARSVSELVAVQVDLVPESRRRLQRNAETRREILSELKVALRELLRYGTSEAI